jgi:predicted signal transduction protein with EAL and GGDEF domain
VTETYLVTDPVVANRNLDVIRKFGVGIALDDFGTGYASIGFLRNFRFEKLKLDRTMVVDAGQDSGSLAMFTSSIAVARAMDMEVTAEGVETRPRPISSAPPAAITSRDGTITRRSRRMKSACASTKTASAWTAAASALGVSMDMSDKIVAVEVDELERDREQLRTEGARHRPAGFCHSSAIRSAAS